MKLSGAQNLQPEPSSVLVLSGQLSILRPSTCIPKPSLRRHSARLLYRPKCRHCNADTQNDPCIVYCRSWSSPQSPQLLQQPMQLPQRPHRRHRPALQHPRRPRRRQRPSTSARTAVSLPRPTPRSWPRTWASTWPTSAAAAPMAVSLLRMSRLPKTEVKGFPESPPIEQDDILRHFTKVITHCKDPIPRAIF